MLYTDGQKIRKVIWISFNLGPRKPIWAAAQDFGTYLISEQGWLRLVCTYVKTQQSQHCLHTQNTEVDEDSDKILDL